MKRNLTLNNTYNAQDDLGADNVRIEVVAFGHGIAMLMADSAVAERLAIEKKCCRHAARP